MIERKRKRERERERERGRERERERKGVHPCLMAYVYRLSTLLVEINKDSVVGDNKF